MNAAEPEQNKPHHWSDEPRNISLLILVQGVVGLLIGLAIWWATGRELSAFVAWQEQDLVVGALLAAAMIGVMVAIMLAFPRFLPWAAEQQRILFENERYYSPLHILFISLGAGVGEEALFRGGLQTFLGDLISVWAAILLVSILFAALHLGRRGIFAFTFAYGAAFGAVYHLTGSLLGMMIAHSLFDVWALAMVQRELKRQGFFD